MSVRRKLLDKFGLTEAMKPEIASLESVLKPAQAPIRRARLDAAKRWHLESGGREFHKEELARRALNESLLRFHVPR